MLVHELATSRPGELLYDALVAALSEMLRRRFAAETGPYGAWAALSPPDCAEADERAAARLDELDRAGRIGGWIPLQPCGLETLRDLIPRRRLLVRTLTRPASST